MIGSDPTRQLGGHLPVDRPAHTRGPSTGSIVPILIRIVWYSVWLLAGLLAIRFVLKLLAADPASRFATVIYQLTFAPLAPFFAIVPTPQFGPVAIEGFTLIAIVGYLLIGAALTKLIELWLPDPEV